MIKKLRTLSLRLKVTGSYKKSISVYILNSWFLLSRPGRNIHIHSNEIECAEPQRTKTEGNLQGICTSQISNVENVIIFLYYKYETRPPFRTLTELNLDLFDNELDLWPAKLIFQCSKIICMYYMQEQSNSIRLQYSVSKRSRPFRVDFILQSDFPSI